MAQATGHSENPRNNSSENGSVVYFSNPLMSDAESDWSPIHDAAYNGQVLMLRNLIAQGICVNQATLDRVTPLHVACLQGHTACARLLIENGANVDVTTLERTTALSGASSQGRADCVILLLKHGTSPQGSSLAASPTHQTAAIGQGSHS
ncbi:hypothetical protein UPYG_G00308650 [Umbra pygmaea]|uniref:Uncharacterized protein n=1 Tax=Umbra pygmaea TaxID=75934 RepID=A0ABD0W0V2_UMBPY